MLKSIKSMRRFLSDVGVLLKTADALMEQAGWESQGEGCVEGGSSSAGSGGRWIPREAVRWYARDDRQDVLAFMGVVLDDSAEDVADVREPLVVAGVLNLLKGAKRGGWNWQIHFFEWNEGKTDGTVFQAHKDDSDWKVDWKPGWGWSKMKMFGRALVEITDEHRLHELIIARLLTLVAESQ
ncbi:MAG TPA: hypothetical protein VH253_06535 [Phycisphaerae bacterium]|nr:hypothetical protein [Phycisphaerae bacterium]